MYIHDNLWMSYFHGYPSCLLSEILLSLIHTTMCCTGVNTWGQNNNNGNGTSLMKLAAAQLQPSGQQQYSWVDEGGALFTLRPQLLRKGQPYSINSFHCWHLLWRNNRRPDGQTEGLRLGLYSVSIPTVEICLILISFPHPELQINYINTAVTLQRVRGRCPEQRREGSVQAVINHLMGDID